MPLCDCTKPSVGKDCLRSLLLRACSYISKNYKKISQKPFFNMNKISSDICKIEVIIIYYVWFWSSLQYVGIGILWTYLILHVKCSSLRIKLIPNFSNSLGEENNDNYYYLSKLMHTINYKVIVYSITIFMFFFSQPNSPFTFLSQLLRMVFSSFSMWAKSSEKFTITYYKAQNFCHWHKETNIGPYQLPKCCMHLMLLHSEIFWTKTWKAFPIS